MWGNTKRFLYTGRICWSQNQKSVLAQLRKKTGYTIANCKKALEMHENDINKAEEWLKQQAQSLGWTKANKLQGRTTSQGLIGVCTQRNHAAIVEVNCETDFVARNKTFHEMVEAACKACMEFAKKEIPPETGGSLMKIALDSDTLKALKHDGKPLADHLALLIGNVGENASLRRAFCYKSQSGVDLVGYTHPADIASGSTLLGKYGTVIALRYKNKVSDTQLNLGKHLCQHVIGMSPNRVGIEGKDEPAKNADDEKTLIFQEYLLDPTTPVNEVLLENGVEVVDFMRYECGENLNDDTNENPNEDILKKNNDINDDTKGMRDDVKI